MAQEPQNMERMDLQPTGCDVIQRWFNDYILDIMIYHGIPL